MSQSLFNKAQGAGLFNKSTYSNMFNKGAKAVSRIGRTIENTLGDASRVGHKVIGAIERANSTIAPAVATAFPEFAPVIMGGSAVANKMLGMANSGLKTLDRVHDNAKRVNKIIA